MPNTNIFFMPASTKLWCDLALELEAKGFTSAIWMGDWRFDEFGRKNFPNAEVLNLVDFHINLSKRPVRFAPSADYLRSRAFIQLKNETLKLMDRQDETRLFGRLERDAYFYSMFNHLYSSIVERKIGALVVGEAPHHAAQLIAYKICESLGIPTYNMLANSYVPLIQVNRSIVGAPIAAAGKRDLTLHFEEIQTAFDAYRDGIPTPLYMKNQANFDKNWKFSKYLRKYLKHLIGLKLKTLLGRPLPKNNNDTTVRIQYPHQKNQKRWLTPFRVNELRLELEKEYARLAQPVDFTDSKLPKFVYFPMPYEPERTSLPDGGDFYEAMDALLALREYLPDDVHIFVKEHPSQFARKLSGHKGRSPFSYQVIKNLHNVRLVDISVPSAKLTENAEFVCVITGTAALEAALIGGKGVVFGTPWFFDLPGVYLFDELPKYEKFMKLPGSNVDAIAKAAKRSIDRSTIPGTISVSQTNYFKQKFGEKYSQLVDEAEMVRLVAETISRDYKSTR